MSRMISIDRRSHVKGEWHKRSRSVWDNRKEGHVAGGGEPGKGKEKGARESQWGQLSKGHMC